VGLFSDRLGDATRHRSDRMEIERTPVMKFPKKVFVYVEVTDRGEEFLSVARDVEDIPEDVDREMVGTYKLKRREQFVVRRILK
jgi:hypothetical protein